MNCLPVILVIRCDPTSINNRTESKCKDKIITITVVVYPLWAAESIAMNSSLK